MSNTTKEIAANRRLLSYAQVAQIMGVDVRTVRRWRSMGRLRAVTFGANVVRFRPAEIDALVAKGWK